MNDSQFNQLVDDTLLAIEDAIDESGAEIDYDTAAGILTLEFENRTKIIINRQLATHELWVAAKSGGFHLVYQDDQWYCNTEQMNLNPLLNRLCTEQAKTSINLEL
jgi:CyaY protein